ncbi:EAL domain-containing protein [Methylobacterium sp. C25]|uniref:putative bifunctional diguanylate cyclase/phosphodiesterase n=1 Tax=Methylobacterium sp. C25 TaxID=2721622 RepID=UPI001F45CCB7|nr:EAL domain-containing protein [Methylobacterium sp. C25]MCE4223712.1 EAL domain-containing protein [Methylobacterium sp. C25]
MASGKRVGRGASEFYDLLCLMMIGVCGWLAGIQLGAFRTLDTIMIDHGLTELVMLGCFVGLGAIVASLHKSLRLRRALRERDSAEAQALSVTRHDALTGLANRRCFVEGVDAGFRREAEKTATVLLIDLDRFKPINDLYGHAAGDMVLCTVAERLKQVLPPGSLAARLGGDEFAAMLPPLAGREAIARVAQGVIAALSAPISWQKSELKIGATIGIALAGESVSGAEAALHAADLAMYQGKKDGRGTFRFFENAMGEELRARALLESELRGAILAGQIEPFYQPVVSLPGRELIGFEVLARWLHPERGVLLPSEFIPIAEETGMIGELSYDLLRQACRDAAAWPSHLQLALNVAPQQFQDHWFAEQILAVLNETGFPAHRLEIEITESALIQDLEATRATLTSLQNLGVRIALDDFGTGYSSLYHLRELKFDKLKIDRSYVNSITMSDERAKLVDAIIKLGSSLGLVMTAEGIETSGSLDWLEGQGCDFGQGYLFGKPMSKPEADMYVEGGAPEASDGAAAGRAAA